MKTCLIEQLQPRPSLHHVDADGGNSRFIPEIVPEISMVGYGDEDTRRN